MGNDSRRCTIEGCENTQRARGWCPKHWKRWSIYGDPMGSYVPKERTPKPPCNVDGCEKPKNGATYCRLHRERFETHGDPLKTLTPNRVIGTDEERFWAKVDAEGDCWEWTACIRKDGYGSFGAGKKSWLAHKYAWMLLLGDVPEGKELDHRCRNRACVNVGHLEPVTHAENVRRGAVAAVARAMAKSRKQDKRRKDSKDA
jgi:hypothetical protein